MAKTTLSQAQAALEAGKWSLAASLFETVYQTTQTLALNLQLVTALKADQKYTLASTYAAEFEADYLVTAERFNLYLAVLLASHQFIKARLITEACRQTPANWLAEADQQITTAEQVAEQTMQQTLTTTMRQFYHLSDQPVAAQAERLAAAQHLTYAKYLTAAKFLLVDPFLHQLSRVEVLYTLRGLGTTDAVQFLWFDQTEQTVVPAELPVIGSDRISQQLQWEIQQQAGQVDATLAAGLQAELPLQLMYLYPTPAKIVTDAKIWINLLIATQRGAIPRHLTVAGQKMAENQVKIREFNENLV